MLPGSAPRSQFRPSSGGAHSEKQAQPQGEAASYFDPTEPFESPSLQGRPTPARNPYEYTENAGEAGQAYTGTAPPISYQQTLPNSAPVPAALVEEPHATEELLSGITVHAEPEHAGAPAAGAHEWDGLLQSQPSAPCEGPEIKPGKLGTIQGFVALARKKPHVRDDTPNRLELLRRADKFFNEGLIGKYGRLNKEKTALFRQEIDRIEAKIGKLDRS